MLDARKLVFGIALAAVAAGSWWLTDRAGKPNVAPGARTHHEPDYVIDGFVGNMMDERGNRRYLLTARRLTHYPDDDTTHLADPLLVQTLPGGVHATTRADAAVMPADGREIVMTGNVHATRTAGPGSGGGEITTERLRIELDRRTESR